MRNPFESPFPWPGPFGRGGRGFGPRNFGVPEAQGPYCHFRGGRGVREEFEFGRHRGRGFGGGPRERLFDNGELQLVLLDLLAQKPSYGYELIKSLEERLAGGYTPSAGVVYPTLTLLEERGFATAENESGKKVYTVTEAGHAELAANRRRLEDITERLNENRERFGRGRSPELMKAMGNLRAAVQARLTRGNLTPEQLTKIAAAIDEAATAIDKL